MFRGGCPPGRQDARDDGTAAAGRERLVQSLERLKVRKREHGWMIPQKDMNAEISFD